MKYFGSILDFTEQRNNELIKAYRAAIADYKQISIKEVAEKVVNTPCSRFWVSEERATVVCSELMKDKPILSSMRQTKREMFQEIFNRVIELKKQKPDETLFNLVLHVVNQPAPKFYMRPRCAMEIIYKIKNGFHGKK